MCVVRPSRGAQERERPVRGHVPRRRRFVCPVHESATRTACCGESVVPFPVHAGSGGRKNRGAMPTANPLHVERNDRENWSIVTLEGEIDWETAPLAHSVIETCLHAHHDVDIDLSAVTFCDVSGLNLFLATIQDATAAGRRLRLSHPAPVVSRLFELSGAGHLLRGPPAPSATVLHSAPLRSAS